MFRLLFKFVECITLAVDFMLVEFSVWIISFLVLILAVSMYFV